MAAVCGFCCRADYCHLFSASLYGCCDCRCADNCRAVPEPILLTGGMNGENRGVEKPQGPKRLTSPIIRHPKGRRAHIRENGERKRALLIGTGLFFTIILFCFIFSFFFFFLMEEQFVHREIEEKLDGTAYSTRQGQSGSL